ncbi:MULTISPECIES: aromatic acid exporter family protein [Pontibacillus]|uniref:Aromatic acid exporter family protein n=1 Tax=Pontibacillus chungwhensis TaxID=265426 RepID=A0ABY8UT02_9BACI|nr:aromatic acid exporter family protein [Pontibacillus chungwhensis]MCD5323249.1 aromatic acid exporter family protein [Pontibacillus sp. HN14]WIF96634.1 aromatic acid exporter family protein [Pontibacillus chungwhensis]
MKIGYRTIKTAVGTPIAIWIAQILALTNFASAGILTILCIQNTRKRSIMSASSRFAACLLAMAFSFAVFETIGYHPLAIGLMLILFIPTTVKLKVKEGIVTSSVIILHLYGSNNIGFETLYNEFLLIVVGIGVALVLNLYMPSLEGNLKEKQRQIENHFSIILKEVAEFLRTGDQKWSGKELTETAHMLEEAKSLAYRDVENHLLRNHHEYYHYFQMRQKQFELLERMLPLISRINSTYEQSMIMAEFFDELSDSVHPGNTAVLFLQQIKKMKEGFKKGDLPQTRKEFEERASLFNLLNEIEQYLIIKRSFKKSDI